MSVDTANARSLFTESEASAIRADFPILSKQVHGKQLAFLDSAASSQKPQQVIDVLRRYYEEENANIHRGVYHLSQIATQKYEDARETVRSFINAASLKEVIFTAGTTDAINLVASSFGRTFLKEGDEIILSTMEHHANIVPWQLMAEERGVVLREVLITDKGELDLAAYHEMLNEKTRLVSLVYASNSLGTINPVREIIAAAKAREIPVMLDAAQAIVHMPIDVQELDCDFLAFSGHKIYGPTGIGVLYGREALLNEMKPYRGGGDMIRTVSIEETTFSGLPTKFEAGTPNISGAIGLAAALDYVTTIGMSRIADWENSLLEYGTHRLAEVPGLRMVGTAPQKVGVMSFVLDNVHPHDIGTFLDQEGVAVRTGHHCTQPIMTRYGLPATTRASLGIYNNTADLDALVDGLKYIVKVFG